MNRRQFGVLIPLLPLLASCEESDNKPASTATLLNNSGVQEALNNLESAVSELESNVGSFDSDNWREVVPEVEAASTNVRDALNTLKSALGAE